MNKAYQRINGGKGWVDYPSDDTAVDAYNLNHMEVGIDEVDNRIINLDETKASKTEISTLFDDVSLDEQTGIITFTRKNGSKLTIDTALEKIATGIYYNPVTEMLTVPLIDGTQFEVDLSRLITEFNFVDSDTIAVSVSTDGNVTAVVKKGSITEEYLQPNFLADVKLESAKAKSSAESAAESKESAENSATEAESYAHGGTGTRENENTDNAKSYSDEAKSDAETAKGYLGKVEKAGDDAVKSIKDALNMSAPSFNVDLSTGHLMYEGGRFNFIVNNNGHLEWGLAV